MTSVTTRAHRDLIIIIIIAVAVFLVELSFDVFLQIAIWAAQYEALLIVELLLLGFVCVTGLMVYAWRRAHDALLLEQELNRSYRSYADAVTQGQEEEQRRLARELHDDTIHRLILLSQQVQLMRFEQSASSTESNLDRMDTTINDTIQYLRRFIQKLRPTYLDELGLTPALQALAQDETTQTKIQIDFRHTGETVRFNEAIELMFYRIAQAAIHNIIHHAHATRAVIRFDCTSEYISMEIEDDGVGFVVRKSTDLAKEGHFGVMGMRERAELNGATFGIRSTIGKGTCISVNLLRSAAENL